MLRGCPRRSACTRGSGKRMPRGGDSSGPGRGGGAGRRIRPPWGVGTCRRTGTASRRWSESSACRPWSSGERRRRRLWKRHCSPLQGRTFRRGSGGVVGTPRAATETGRVGGSPYRAAMRLLHTSDRHIGRTLHTHSTLEHLGTVLGALVTAVREQAVDVVLVAGDVFDSAAPSTAAIELFQSALGGLRHAGAEVVITSGNHDSVARLGMHADWLGAA